MQLGYFNTKAEKLMIVDLQLYIRLANQVACNTEIDNYLH